METDIVLIYGLTSHVNASLYFIYYMPCAATVYSIFSCPCTTIIKNKAFHTVLTALKWNPRFYNWYQFFIKNKPFQGIT